MKNHCKKAICNKLLHWVVVKEARGYPDSGIEEMLMRNINSEPFKNCFPPLISPCGQRGRGRGAVLIVVCRRRSLGWGKMCRGLGSRSGVSPQGLADERTQDAAGRVPEPRPAFDVGAIPGLVANLSKL